MEYSLLQNHTLRNLVCGSTDLFFPEQLIAGEKRGGAPLCAPMFSVQQRPVTGCQLPIHGMLPYLDDKPTLTSPHTTHHPATTSYAWDFTATTSVDSTDHSFNLTCTITRSPECVNPHEMPLSLAWHPYFATYGADFSFTIGAKSWKKATIPDSIIDSHFTTYNEAVPVMIKTDRSVITMTSTGFDEYCLWTDNLERYICIEPIYQYREFGLPGTGLQPGEEKTVSVQLEVMLRAE